MSEKRPGQDQESHGTRNRRYLKDGNPHWSDPSKHSRQEPNHLQEQNNRKENPRHQTENVYSADRRKFNEKSDRNRANSFSAGKRLFFEQSSRGKWLRFGAFIILGMLLGCIVGPVKAATMGPDQSGETQRAMVESTADTSQSGTGQSSTSGLSDTADSLAEGQDAGMAESGLNTGEGQAAAGAQNLKTVKLLAVGDDLIHSGIFKSGLQSDGTYNFDHLYENVKDEISAADLAIVNQETIFTYNRNDYSGYPCFAGPVEIGDALVDAGFDVVTHATNHTFDRNVQGILDTMDFWKTNHPDITVLGVHESQEDADTIKTVECNGITFAMLNYTYGLNGFTLPDDQPYLVDILDKEKVARDIARAKEISDCVVFFLHCGVEYTYDPSAETKDWVQFLLENGVDITIASHPHVLEPYAMLTGEDGHEMLVYYSMGNFISTQDEYPRLIGGMAEITVQLKGQGDSAQLSVVDYGLEPLYTHYNHNTGVYTVYKFSDYTDDLAAQNAMNGKNGIALTRQVIWDEFNEIMSTPIEQPGAASVYQPWLETDHELPQLGERTALQEPGSADWNAQQTSGAEDAGSGGTSQSDTLQESESTGESTADSSEAL